MILDEIIEHKRAEVKERKAQAPIDSLEREAALSPPVRDFTSALRTEGPTPAVIAEIKKASPSKGVIRADFDPPAIAKAYEYAGAAAISVLTDEKFFQGSLNHLRAVRQTVSIPVLRKDFIIDPYQVYEARAAGADAALLIAAALSERELAVLFNLCQELGMSALVEVHSEREIKMAVNVGARIIGINNRDLQTFKVDISTTLRLQIHIPEDRIIISESGILSREDIRYLKDRDVDAVLIGEALMRAPDPGIALKELLS